MTLTRHTLLLVATLATCGLAYAPGLAGTWLLDDYSNIVSAPAIRIDALTPASVRRLIDSGAASDIGRPIANLSFAIDYMIGGLTPRQFLTTNLIIHLFCAALAFLLARQIGLFVGAPATPIALFSTAAWSLHPYNLSAVLYAVQRMTSLAALFSLAALTVYVMARRRIVLSWSMTALGILLVGALSLTGLLCKETAALVPLFIAAFELTIGRTCRQTNDSTQQRAWIWCCGFLPSLLLCAYLLWKIPAFAHAHEYRPFSLTERLLSEGRILWVYLGQLLAPTNATMSLFHDDFVPSESLFRPMTTGLAIAGLTLLATVAMYFRRTMPWLSFGVLFFLLGHLLESTVIPLELMFEHRNYMPATGLLIGITGQAFSSLAQSSDRIRTMCLLAALAMLCNFAIKTHQRAALWGSPVEHLEFWLAQKPDSPRVQMAAAIIYDSLCRGDTPSDEIEAALYCTEAYNRYLRAADLDNGDAGALILAAENRFRNNAPVDLEIRQRIISELSTARFRWTTYNTLHKVLVEADPARALPAVWLANWAEAALSNPTSPGRAKVMIRAGYAQLLFNRMGRFEYAEEQLARAVQSRTDDIGLMMQLVQLRLARGNFVGASEALDDIRGVQGSWAYSGVIDALDRELGRSVVIPD